MDDISLDTTDEPYLPAVSLETDFGPIEAIVSRVLGAHGVVPVPDRSDELVGR